MGRIQTGTLIEDKTIQRAVTAKGYLGRCILITNVWEQTCVSFVNKLGYFVDDDPNEHIKRNLQPNTYVFTPVVRLTTSPQGDVVSSQCKVEYLRLSPNRYNKLCESIRRNPTFTHLELVADSSGQFETTDAIPVSTTIPFVNEIQSFINSLDAEALLKTIKSEMGSPLSVLDERLEAQKAAALITNPVQEPQGQPFAPSQAPAFQQFPNAFQHPQAFQMSPAQAGQIFQQPVPTPVQPNQAFQQPQPAFQQPVQPSQVFQQPAFQQPVQGTSNNQGQPNVNNPVQQKIAFQQPVADKAGASDSTQPPVFQFPPFGGFKDEQ